MNAEQRALRFGCQGSCLVGIIDLPERPLPRGVLVLAGGPQYRIGSHRQFTLLARLLAGRGIPVMRFDQRGMGDSDGDERPGDAIEDDVRAAIREFFVHVPDLQEIVLWGLGDAAAAALQCTRLDPRIAGVVLLNPWAGRQVQAHRPTLLDRLGANLRQPMLQPLVERLAGFAGQRLVILSASDPLASQFASMAARADGNIGRVMLDGADPGFASREWRDQVAEISANWLLSW